MKNARDILRLPIVELREGKEKGRASDIVLSPDSRKVYFIIIGKRARQILMLNASDIIGMGEDFMLIRDEGVIHAAETEEEKMILDRGVSLLDIMAVSATGDKIGKVKDFTLDEEKRIQELVLENGESVEAGKIISLCEEYIFIGEEGDKDRIVREKITYTKPSGTISPLGLKLTRQVRSADGAFVAEEGSVISSELLEQAERHGVLVELAMYAE